MVVFWSVGLAIGVDEWVHFCACSKCVEVGDFKDFEFCHEGSGVCSGWFVCDDADDFLLGSDKWLDVRFLCVSCAPDGDISDEVWVYVREV